MTSTEDRPLIDMLSLAGKVAVVTGAGQGIGLAIARRLSEAGAHVVLGDIEDRVHDAAESLSELGRSVSSTLIDVTEERDHRRVAGEAVDRHGRLDIWVNNAGIYPATLALDISAEEWRRVHAVNLDGAFFGARSAAAEMIPRGTGVILTVGSTSGFRVSDDGRAHYASSKRGVRGLIQALAREWGPHGIRVLGIAPVATVTEGSIEGARLVERVHDGEPAQDLFERFAERIPLRRVATADDMALVATFCVSDLAGYVTGSVIPVDGGYLAV